ncbi:MAG: sigma-70 family RNA polymerase sigma factor [Myxococcales bacterium]|nr:sigma-70 family RNA polymerase sigma factor [Myxococcales bacterium]
MQTESVAQAQPTSAATRGRQDPAELEQERILLEGLMQDDPRAWQEFNTRYSRLIYRCITRVTARFSAVVGPDDIREIYAMLCLSLLAKDKRKLRSFEPGRGNKLGSWIGMLAIHTAYDHLRSLKREPKRGCLSEAESLTSDTPDPFETLLMRQRATIVSQLLEQFSEKDRQFITLYYGEGLEPEQIADTMQISVKTVYSKKHKIRNRLAALLQEQALAA